MCDCIELTEAALEKQNQRLPLMLSLTGGPHTPYFRTEVIEKRRGARPMNLVPTYCPFCGVKYTDTAPAEAAMSRD